MKRKEKKLRNKIKKNWEPILLIIGEAISNKKDIKQCENCEIRMSYKNLTKNTENDSGCICDIALQYFLDIIKNNPIDDEIIGVN